MKWSWKNQMKGQTWKLEDEQVSKSRLKKSIGIEEVVRKHLGNGQFAQTKCQENEMPLTPIICQH
jgi:hypothetical protein